MDAGFYPIAEETRERTLEQARAQLSESAFAAAWAKYGRRRCARQGR